MRKSLFLFNTACLLSILLLASCHTSKRAVASKNSSQPKFINDIYINGHNKNNATVNAIEPKKKADKGKSKAKSAQSEEFNEDIAVTDPRLLRKKYAEILGIKSKEITNYPLYEFIDHWYGTNYRLGGSDKSGIDCSGFAQKLYGEVYGTDLLRTAMEQFSNCKRIKHVEDAEEGDLVFFHVHSKRITHVGIYLTNNYFVHASTSQGVVISNLNDEYWHKYYAGMGRVPKG